MTDSNQGPLIAILASPLTAGNAHQAIVVTLLPLDDIVRKPESRPYCWLNRSAIRKVPRSSSIYTLLYQAGEPIPYAFTVWRSWIKFFLHVSPGQLTERAGFYLGTL